MIFSRSPRSSRLLGAAVTAAVCFAAVAPLAHAQPQPPPPGGGGAADKAPGDDPQLYSCGKARGPISVTLRPETELKDLLAWAMGFTCKNFIYESSILQRSKKLTIIAPNKMSAQQAYRLFLVSLSTMGLAVVPKGNVLRVVEAGNAKGETVPIYRKGSPADSDEVVRLVLRPQNIPAEELANALSVVKSPIGAIQPVARAGALIITDYGSNIRQMITLTRELDQPSSGEGIYTIQVKYADAVALQQKLAEILGVGQNQGGMAVPMKGNQVNPGAAGVDVDNSSVATAVPSKILADERSNTLILVASEAGYLRVKGLVDRLDVEIATTSAGSVHVYRLQNAQAEELAQTLNGALSGAGNQAQGAGARRPGAAVPPQGRGQIDNVVGNAGGAAFEGQVRITHDAPTNSLVVLASARDFQALKDVVAELDTPRRQVFIEAVILELNVGNGLDLGSSFHGGYPLNDGEDGVLLGGVQGSDLKSIDVSTLAGASGLIGGLIGPLLSNSEELLGTTIPSYAVLFQALAKSSNVNVLSSPHILTTNNEEAEISVGQNIPYQGGVTFGLGGIGGAAGVPGLGSLSIQRQDIQLSMKITPAINASDMVRLKIEQEIQDVGDKDPQLGPTWTKRKIKTTVVVRDQQSIVIGGLMSDRTSYTESKVPLLGDVPILGYLFKYTKREKKKTNLLVLLTPYVINDQLDLQTILERKLRERNEFLRAFSNLDRTEFLPKTDYRRKRGLLEEINRQVLVVERDREVLKALSERPPSVPDGPIDYKPRSGAEGLDDDEAPASQPSTPSTSPTTTPTPPPASAPITGPTPPTAAATVKGAARP
jgi:general secretion pathway protein D